MKRSAFLHALAFYVAALEVYAAAPALSSPIAQVEKIQQRYLAATKATFAYANLPACGKEHHACQDPATRARVMVYRDIARAAFRTADAAARSPGYDAPATAAAIAAADKTIGAYSALVATLARASH